MLSLYDTHATRQAIPFCKSALRALEADCKLTFTLLRDRFHSTNGTHGMVHHIADGANPGSSAVKRDIFGWGGNIKGLKMSYKLACPSSGDFVSKNSADPGIMNVMQAFIYDVQNNPRSMTGMSFELDFSGKAGMLGSIVVETAGFGLLYEPVTLTASAPCP